MGSGAPGAGGAGGPVVADGPTRLGSGGASGPVAADGPSRLGSGGTGRVRWLLCDYGQVLCRAPSPAERDRLAGLAGRDGPSFWRDYWEHRPAYDRADLTAAAYWAEVLGAAPSPSLLADLVAADTASWLHPDGAALAAAARVAAAGVRLAILSNAPREVGSAIDAQPWLGAFSPRLFSYQLGAVKPEPEIYEAAVRALGADPSEIAFLDDRPANVEGARSAGLHAEVYRGPAQFDALAGDDPRA